MRAFSSEDRTGDRWLWEALLPAQVGPSAEYEARAILGETEPQEGIFTTGRIFRTRSRPPVNAYVPVVALAESLSAVLPILEQLEVDARQ